MNLYTKCLPVGTLPYDKQELALKLITKLFENIPFLPSMPKAADAEEENIEARTLSNIPVVQKNGKKYLFNANSDDAKQALLILDAVFNNPDLEGLDIFNFESFFLDKYLQLLNRIKPKETVVNLLGPISLAQKFDNKTAGELLADKYYRKFIIQTICIKALWIIHKIKEASSETTPIIILEEPLLNKIGQLRRENEEISIDTFISIYTKVINKIHEFQGAVGIQSFEKCDWQIPIQAGVDIISFDAYNNPNNLNIIPDKVNEFLANGGRINWGIVPVMNESIVRSISIDSLYSRFIKTIEGLINCGVSERLAYNRSMVSIQGDADKLPLIFAEKAIMLASQLAKKIPQIKQPPKSDSNQ